MRHLVIVVVAAASMLLLALVSWGEPWVGRSVGFSQLIAMRPLVTLFGLIVAAVLLASALMPRRRLTALISGTLVALLAVSNVMTLTGRGLDTTTPEAAATEAASAPTGALRVLSWNTTPTGVPVDDVARLAVQLHADVVALPETRPTRAARIADRMHQLGQPMWVIPDSSDTTKYTMSLLVAARFSYAVEPDTSATGFADGVRGGVLAAPTRGGGPEIAVVHVQQPGFSRSRAQAGIWRAHLDWVRRLCASGRQLVIAGDFNATVDNLGAVPGCTLAAQQTGTAGATGTWPTGLPAWAGANIDHVLVTSGWRADTFRVLSGHDRSGSDHRPVFAVLVPTG